MQKFMLLTLFAIGLNAIAQEKVLSSDIKTSRSPVVDSSKLNEIVKTMISTGEISSDGKMLIFRSQKNYLDFISNEENKDAPSSLIADPDEKLKALTRNVSRLRFKNYFSTKRPEFRLQSKIPAMDEYLGLLLNQDGVIQIGNHAFKVDLLKDIVFSIPSKDLSQNYNDLVNGNTKNKKIRVFSTGQGVLDLVEGKESSQEKSCGGIGGGTYPSYPHESQGSIVLQTPGTIWRLNPYVQFFRAGIYFRLSSKFLLRAFQSAQDTSLGTQVNSLQGLMTIEMFIKWPEGWRKRQYCGSGTVNTVGYGLHWSTSTTGEGTSKTVYVGAYNLNGYYLFVQGRSKFTNQNGSIGYTLATPYGGRNINSPY